MPGTQQRDNMGKVQDNSTPSSTNPVGDFYSGIPLGVTKDTYLRGTIADIYREIKEYKQQVRELRRENEKFKKDLEGENDKFWKEVVGENDKLQKEVETLKREANQRIKELQEETEKLQKEVEILEFQARWHCRETLPQINRGGAAF